MSSGVQSQGTFWAYNLLFNLSSPSDSSSAPSPERLAGGDSRAEEEKWVRKLHSRLALAGSESERGETRGRERKSARLWDCGEERSFKDICWVSAEKHVVVGEEKVTQRKAILALFFGYELSLPLSFSVFCFDSVRGLREMGFWIRQIFFRGPNTVKRCRLCF